MGYSAEKKQVGGERTILDKLFPPFSERVEMLNKQMKWRIDNSGIARPGELNDVLMEILTAPKYLIFGTGASSLAAKMVGKVLGEAALETGINVVISKIAKDYALRTGLGVGAQFGEPYTADEYRPTVHAVGVHAKDGALSAAYYGLKEFAKPRSALVSSDIDEFTTLIDQIFSPYVNSSGLNSRRESSSPWNMFYQGNQLWDGLSPDFKTSNAYNFDTPVISEPTPLLDYWANNRPVDIIPQSPPRTPAPRRISIPSRDANYLDMGDFTFPDNSQPTMSPAEQAFLAELDRQAALEAANMLPDPELINRLYGEIEAAPAQDSGSTTPGDSVPRVKQPSVIDYAGSAIGTAYNVMSFGSTLQDVLTGRRSDPGAYLSLANSTAQGLNWLAKTDGVKDIVSAIGDLQGPLDKLGNVTGGAVAGWGLYQNISGLAKGEVTPQNVLGAAANSSALYQTAFKPLPARSLALAA